ncbi:MAG: hypothetical protein EUB_03435 [Eubacterium sp.]|uniref:phage tail sheath subtilisin-like domain-containing protein n=1 Tax=Eubacterium sp. TaxID=142586 RepID=UPI003056B227
MAMFFEPSENKIRPGVYNRYVNPGGAVLAGAQNGIIAAVVQSNWGELGKVVVIDSVSQIAEVFGSGGTTEMLEEAFNGGATTIYAIRLGTAGTKGVGKLKDTTSGTPIDAVTISLKCEGNRPLEYTLRNSLGDASTKEFLITENSVILEKILFAASDDAEVDAFIEAAATAKYFSAVKVTGYSGTGKFQDNAKTAFTSGANPTVNNESYSKAFSALERYPWNVLIVDTDDIAVHTLAATYMNRMYQLGKMGFFVVGEPSTVSFEERLAHSRAFNDKNVIYLGVGWVNADGKKYDGFLAAARIGGMVAAIPSNQSLTHNTIAGAVSPIDVLTNSQLESAIQSGMLALSISAAGAVQIDAAITTLHSPTGEDDAGWKKIRRCKTRKELFTRVSDTLEPMIGTVNNDADGKAFVQQTIIALLNAMIGEKKIKDGASVEIEENSGADADAAYFRIKADDFDSLEKIYLTYEFRFNAA